MGRRRSAQGPPAVAMINPSTELMASCAVVSAYTVRSACVTVTPTVSNETRALSRSTAGAICSAAGQCGWSAAASGQLAHWLKVRSVQNGGGGGGGMEGRKIAACEEEDRHSLDPV